MQIAARHCPLLFSGTLVRGLSCVPKQLHSLLQHQPRRTMALFFMDDFARRQFEDDTYQGTRIRSHSANAFLDELNRRCTDANQLQPGYAPFCKHVFVPNFTDALLPVIPLTPEVESLVVTGYLARTPKELPVLTRWVPLDKYKAPKAEYLDVILYSRDQVVEEHAAMKDAEAAIPDRPWGVISIKAQSEGFETPMNPITMMRNALGKEEGGSGVPLSREEYLKSVEYWSKHVALA